MRGRELFQKYYIIILWITNIIKLVPLSLRKKMLYFFRSTRGRKGMLIRYMLIKTIAKKCGKNVSIHDNVYIFYPENLVLGNNISIHPMGYLDACGGIEIGSDVSIAHGTTILSSEHEHKDLTIPIKDQGIINKNTKISDNVWIASKCTILGGANISSGVIVAANAVVKGNSQKNSIIGGIPAKKIKERGLHEINNIS